MYLKVNELNKFLEKRYGYLNQLMVEIDKQYKAYKQEMNHMFIKENDDICKQLEILKVESSKRLDLHKILIDKLIMFFTTPIIDKENEKMVDEYKKALKPVVKQIYNSLQALEYDGVDYDALYISTNKLQNGYAYYIEKLSSYIYGTGYHSSFWEPRLRGIFKDHFVMEYKSYEELYILINSCIYKLNKN